MSSKRLRRSRRLLSNDPEAAARAQALPHVALRWMAACYARAALEWTTDPLGAGFVHGNRVLRVLDPEPSAGVVFTPPRRAAVVEVAQVCADRLELMLCVVFGPRDCVMVSPGRACRVTAHPPQGGVSLYDLQQVRVEEGDWH